MKLGATHVAEAQVHDPWRRTAHENAIREIGILGDDYQLMRSRVGPQFAVGGIFSKILRMTDGQRRSERQPGGQVFVQKKAGHARAAIWK